LLVVLCGEVRGIGLVFIGSVRETWYFRGLSGGYPLIDELSGKFTKTYISGLSR